MNKLDVYLGASLAVTLTVVLLLPSFESSVNATDRNWRFDQHDRNIDIDICIRCESPIPGPPGPQGPPGEQGPPGPQGPPGDTRQTIVTLHDDAEGNAAGWNPPLENTNIFIIKAPFELEPGFSLEATFTNPSKDSPGGEVGLRSGNCHLAPVFDTGDSFPIICSGSIEPTVVEEGATLTYIITK